MTFKITHVLTFASLLLIFPFASAQEKPRKMTDVDGMTSYNNLKYLPAARYSGDEVSDRGDYELLLDLHIPKEGKGPFPVVFYVHGGSYTGGHKEGQSGFAEELNRRGIAYCGFNYILQPKGIFPQVYWDFHNAARYLRMNAEKYNLDPLRFGAYGISAGGWLVSSATVPNADHFQTGQSYAVSMTQYAEKNWNVSNRKRPDEIYSWVWPLHDPQPAWPGEFGGFSAISFDFAYHLKYGSPASPAILGWTGKGHKFRDHQAMVENGVPVYYAEMTAGKWAGRSVHVPPFFERGGREGAETLDLEGNPGKVLGEVVADFFVRELMSPQAKAPTAEIYPIPRIVNGPTEVSMIAPRGATVYYTTDGSEPGPGSPAYTKPFTVTPGTIVKAITTAKGMQPSGIEVATFLPGPEIPEVTGPDALPSGETGKPYSVTFTSNSDKSRWLMNGDLAPKVEENGTISRIQNGMSMDRDSGTWSGIPLRPGSFWLQVWVNEGSGKPGGYRNYRWTVTGDVLSAQEKEAVLEDLNIEFATLTGWPEDDVSSLIEYLGKKGVNAVSPHEANSGSVTVYVISPLQEKATNEVNNWLRNRKELKEKIVFAPTP